MSENTLTPTAGQTVGPFFHYGLEFEGQNLVAFPHSPGAIVLRGTVRDGNGAPIPDACIEIFGADADGSVPRARGTLRRDGFSFTGFGRAFTDDEGGFFFWTRNPGATDENKPPFIAAIVFARGLPNKLHTRIYLPEAIEAGQTDALLDSLSEAERATLVATRTEDGNLVHDIRVQGEGETVFIAYS
ncbi:protocatechuate 3,4-dioxygenase subunit alpha [Microbacterium sp. Marseille-Q6965]|uniref:protocatechuate 3,4-dioxygenase subunit alpha n=1 Tax=Microbacterium sp. Marseille-Q6965 TaxID=2965072 RepID=UPI0021B78BCB|nr:protocatechuate 3,4-dioxygenase subunit alpha [Microbacterium sp. Marseille-Q6965]